MHVCAILPNQPVFTPSHHHSNSFFNSHSYSLSFQVFVGPYVPKEARPAFTESYFKINEGLLSFPVAFPGSPLWRAIKAREKLIVVLLEAVRQSKKRMGEGEIPKCLLDYWMEEYLKDPEPAQKEEEVRITKIKKEKGKA